MIVAKILIFYYIFGILCKDLMTMQTLTHHRVHATRCVLKRWKDGFMVLIFQNIPIFNAQHFDDYFFYIYTMTWNFISFNFACNFCAELLLDFLQCCIYHFHQNFIFLHCFIVLLCDLCMFNFLNDFIFPVMMTTTN